MKQNIEASAAEWEVLRVIWRLDQASSKRVSEVLKSTQDWENATTKTLLGRLVKKGYLKTEKIGNKFIYHATIDEQSGVNNRTQDLMNSICSTTRGSAIASIIRDYDLSEDDKNLIMSAINTKEFKETLTCQCLGNCACSPGECTCGTKS